MVKYNDSARHIHRPIPCPAYDIPRTEAWLEDMAKEGYLLSRDGFFMGFADFEQASPCTVKYRMQAARYGKSAFDEGEPPEAEAQFHEEMGWEYVAGRGEFHIYRCSDPHAPELNTDPLIQAQTVKAVQKRMRAHTVSMILWLIIYPIFFYGSGIVRGAIATGTFFALYTAALVLWALSGEIRALSTIGRLKKALLSGLGFHKRPDWRKNSIRHISFKGLFIVAAIVWVILVIGLFARYSHNEKPLEEFPGEPPFATLEDIFTEAENYEPVSFMGVTNNFEYASAPLISPESIIWREAADFSLPDTGATGGSLTLYYHEMSHPLLARILAWEILRDAKDSKYFEYLPTPDIETDYLIAYTDHFPHVLIREGNIVIEASFFPYNSTSVDLDVWALPLAESIKTQ